MFFFPKCACTNWLLLRGVSHLLFTTGSAAAFEWVSKESGCYQTPQLIGAGDSE
jgi:hypothetical protein